MALVQLISLIVTELRMSGLNGWLALYLLLSLAAIAGIVFFSRSAIQLHRQLRRPMNEL